MNERPMEQMTVQEVMSRLGMIEDKERFDRAWAALGLALIEALRQPPRPFPLVEIGEACPIPEYAAHRR